MRGLPSQDKWVTGCKVLASLLLLVSGVWLPWAIYRTANVVVTFNGAHLGLVLVACAVGSLGLVTGSVLWNWVGTRWPQLLLGCIAFICSLVMAFSKIGGANQLASIRFGLSLTRTGVGAGYSTTFYGTGAGLSIAASVAMVLLSAVRSGPNKASEQATAGRTKEAPRSAEQMIWSQA